MHIYSSFSGLPHRLNHETHACIVHVCICMYVYICLCVRIYAHRYIHTYTHTLIHTCILTHVHTYSLCSCFPHRLNHHFYPTNTRKHMHKASFSRHVTGKCSSCSCEWWRRLGKTLRAARRHLCGRIRKRPRYVCVYVCVCLCMCVIMCGCMLPEGISVGRKVCMHLCVCASMRGCMLMEDMCIGGFTNG
jgi:hypothetical protein